ncbi:MAG: glyoxalase [Saprospiraceae bacterium]
MSLEKFNIKTLRTFVPAKDYELSRKFYKKIGFEETFYSEDLAVFNVGNFSFYLQNFYQKKWAENFMMFMEVENVDEFWKYLLSLSLESDFPTIKLRRPKTEDWGREFHLIDPTGVLWHFATF